MRKILCIYFCVVSAAIAQSQSPAAVRFTQLSGVDSGIPNDCLPVAMRVYHALPPPPTCTWKRLLSARYTDGRKNHVYCVFSLGTKVYAYDTQWGSRQIYPLNTSAASVVRAVDFQAAYGVYLDQEKKEKPALTVATNTQTSKLRKATRTAKRKIGARARPAKARKKKPDPSRMLQDVVRLENGWGRNRTADTRIFSPLLCQLSYPAETTPLS